MSRTNRIMSMACIAGVCGIACGGPRLKEHAVTGWTYQPVTRCSQQPIDAHFQASGATWGESITIRACGPHGFRGEATIEVDGGDRVGGWGSGMEFGDWDNARCVLRDAEVVAGQTAPASPAPDSVAGDPGAATRPAATTTTTSQSEHFQKWLYTGQGCEFTSSWTFDIGAHRRGADIRVRVWSRQPNDVEGASIHIIHNAYKPNVSDDEWRRHLARKEAEATRKAEEARRRAEREPRPTEAELRARLADAEAASAEDAGGTGELLAGPTSPPPAPRAETIPPRPSVNAEWVPGYWHWNGETGAWVAITGQWRVPQSDIQDGLTATAPRPPPASRDETRPEKPTPDAVWAAGYWAWSGDRFVWIAGSWQIPPSATMVWQPPSWRLSASGVVLAPGGWQRR